MKSPHLWLALTVFAVMGGLMGCQHDDRPRARTAAGKGLAGDQSDIARADSAPPTVNNEKLQVVALLTGPMPTGVTVSKSGRIFVNFPRWGDDVEFTVGELKHGKVTPYPNRSINKLTVDDPADTLVSVQSVVVDDHDRLWILDTGSINFQPVREGGPKLLCVDLKTNRIIKTIHFKPDVALKTSYLNDIRFDLGRGKAGLGFITDSSDSGPNGIIVVDLDSGDAWRKLNDFPSTKADWNFAPVVEGQPLMARPPNGPAAYIKVGSDGIAISSDKKTLFYCPMASRRLYSVSVDVLARRGSSDAEAAATIKQHPRNYASDGLDCDDQNNLYLSDYEHNAIHRRAIADDKDEILVTDPRMIWPDTLCAAPDGFLYFTCNQLNRQKQYHQGRDLRQQPYLLLKYPIGSKTGRTETAMRDGPREPGHE
jgi:sugar lactone lactonase YvrE